MISSSEDPDVIIIGGGISGLAAALRLKDHGLQPLILEREHRVGGRMTTDRIDGFIIDRGVTLLGNRFGRMRSLCRRLGLGPQMQSAAFSFGLQDKDRVHGFRAGRVDDILSSSLLSAKAKAAFLQLSADMLLHTRGLTHGRSDQSESIDNESVLDYLKRFGEGGVELFEKLLQPGLRGPVGGHLPTLSRAILLQTVWNVLVWGTWTITEGLDRLPERIAAELRIQNGVTVGAVQRDGEGVQVVGDTADGRAFSLAARVAIFAIPGNLVPSLCPSLPGWLTGPLQRTEYSPMVSAHVALKTPPNTPYPGFSFAEGVLDGVEMEMEHLRLPKSCPEGQGLVSLYFYPCDNTLYQGLDDTNLRIASTRIVENVFPEVMGQVLFVHVIRWQNGLAQFPPGRLTEMARLRRQLLTFDQPFEFCGDYWDGLSSEGALRSGEQAADRLSMRLSRRFSN
jgi:oxygen-dependent protoporphyrinogen oxidase